MDTNEKIQAPDTRAEVIVQVSSEVQPESDARVAWKLANMCVYKYA